MKYKITSLWIELNPERITPFFAEGFADPPRVSERLGSCSAIAKEVLFSLPIVVRCRIMVSTLVLSCLLKQLGRCYQLFKPFYGDVIWFKYVAGIGPDVYTKVNRPLFVNDILSLEVFMIGICNWFE